MGRWVKNTRFLRNTSTAPKPFVIFILKNALPRTFVQRTFPRSEALFIQRDVLYFNQKTSLLQNSKLQGSFDRLLSLFHLVSALFSLVVCIIFYFFVVYIPKFFLGLRKIENITHSSAHKKQNTKVKNKHSVSLVLCGGGGDSGQCKVHTLANFVTMCSVVCLFEIISISISKIS